MTLEKNEGAQQANTAAHRSGQGYAASASHTDRTRGIMELNALRRAGITRHGVGETVESYRRGFEKLLETLPAEDRKAYTLEIMTQDVDKIYMNTLLVGRPVASNGQTYVAVFALPIEASRPIEGRRVLHTGQTTTEISWAATDVLDDEFYVALERWTANKYGSDTKLLFAGGRPLPLELKSDDEKHLGRVLHEVDQALWNVLETRVTGISNAVVSVGMFVNDGARAQVEVDPTPADRDDSVGLPVRSNLNVSLRATKNVSQAAQNQSLNQRDQDLLITRVDAYIDATYDTTHLAQTPSFPGGPIDTRRFIPRVMITAVDSGQELLTPELTLLGIASTTVLSQHIGLWANTLRPRYATALGQDLARMSDIGALGLAVPLNRADPNELARVSTDPREFSDQDFETLIAASFIPDPIYTLVVPEFGERSWLHEMFQFAANGNQSAYNQIVQTADNLTGGIFSRLWEAEGGGPIVHNDNNRIHLGYFVDASGKRVDLQHIDTLAMLNLFGEKDPAVAFEFINTFNPATGTLEDRLSKREHIIRNTFSQVTIKGYGRTVTFYAKALAVLMQAIAQAGLSMTPSNTHLNDFQSKPKFGVFDPNQFSVGAARTGGAFSSSQLNLGNGSRYVGGMMGSRYSRF